MADTRSANVQGEIQKVSISSKLEASGGNTAAPATST